MAEPLESSSRGLRLRTLLAIDAALVLACLAAWMILGGAIATHMERSVDLAFAFEEDSLDAFMARVTVAKTNESALRLEFLAIPLGIRFHYYDEIPPELHFKDPITAARNFVECQLESPFAKVEPLPPSVAAFFAENAEVFAAVRAHLATAPQPRWRTTAYGSSGGSLLACYQLQRLLAADALEQVRRGERHIALEDLEASWNLAVFAVSDPSDFSRMYATSSARLQAGILRKLGEVPDPWQDRFRKSDPGDFSHYYWLQEAWLSRELSRNRAARRKYFGDYDNWKNRLLALPLTDPYLRMCLAGRRDSLRRAARAEREYPRCQAAFHGISYDYSQHFERHRPEPAVIWRYQWDFAGQWLAIPNLGEMRRREDRLRLERELALKVAVISERRRKLGEWPIRVPGIESSICAGRWIYRGSARGAYLTYSRPLPQLGENAYQRLSWFQVPLLFVDGDPPPL